MENQKSFFEEISSRNTARPLASRLRPKNIADVVGQDHLLGDGKPLRRMIETDNLSSMILYGPPGSGKTTLAYVISQSTNCDFITINATSAGIKDIRQAVDDAIKNNNLYGKKTILFIDEIHRFNTSQQDALLPYVEDGVVIIIGATTENPYFEVNSPLISRLTVFTLKELDNSDIKKILTKAINDKNNGFGNYNITLNSDAEEYIVSVSSGDARFALNTLELCVLTAQKDDEGKIIIDLALAKQSAQNRIIIYDKNKDSHYDTISAFIKSLRGSSPDAAVFYLAKMLLGGEDIKFIGRRMIIFASEDIGNADTNALNVAVNAFNAAAIVGMPEAKIILSQAAVYLSCAPKSNSSYLAVLAAEEDIKSGVDVTVPVHLRDSSYKNKQAFGYGKDYKYPHDYEGGYVEQNYLPKGAEERKYYHPKKIGKEEELYNYLKKIEQQNQK